MIKILLFDRVSRAPSGRLPHPSAMRAASGVMWEGLSERAAIAGKDWNVGQSYRFACALYGYRGPYALRMTTRERPHPVFRPPPASLQSGSQWKREPHPSALRAAASCFAAVRFAIVALRRTDVLVTLPCSLHCRLPAAATGRGRLYAPYGKASMTFPGKIAARQRQIRSDTRI